MNPQQLQHFRHLLTQQKAALEALDSGDATATVALDKSAVGRLEFNPAAQRCIACSQ